MSGFATMIYSDKRSSGDLYQYLRCQKARRKRYDLYDRRGRIPNQASIDRRPAIIDTRQRRHFENTRPQRSDTGERRKPRANGHPSYICIDTVHQGNLDKQKGVYHYTARPFWIDNRLLCLQQPMQRRIAVARILAWPVPKDVAARRRHQHGRTDTGAPTGTIPPTDTPAANPWADYERSLLCTLIPLYIETTPTAAKTDIKGTSGILCLPNAMIGR